MRSLLIYVFVQWMQNILPLQNIFYSDLLGKQRESQFIMLVLCWKEYLQIKSSWCQQLSFAYILLICSQVLKADRVECFINRIALSLSL